MKLTPQKFIRASRLLGGPDFVASIIRPECLPDMQQVAELAEEEATRIQPSDANIPLHCELLAIAEWAKEAV